MSVKDPLLQSLDIKSLRLRNRIVSTAHEPAYAVDGLPKERYRLYHEEKAHGGLALTMIGGSALVSADSPPAFGNLNIASDAIVPWLGELADGVHAHGAAVMCQITHMGRRTYWNKGDWLPIVSASRVREAAHRGFPKEMEASDIRRIVGDYAAAARRCLEGGLDGVEIEAYGHLIDSFWAPRTNLRQDEYGGSLENRMRFGMEVLEAVREAVGSSFIVGIRMVVDECIEGGLTRDDGLEIARRMSATGMLDFINVIQGHIDTERGLAAVIPGMGTPSAPHLQLAKQVRDATGIIVMHAARIADLSSARHALESGSLDLVGMTRAHMADPHIVAKLMRKEEERIRPCVGVGYCIDRIYEGGDALCAHNPATGRERSLPHVVNKTSGRKRRVVVVGGGPAGLEAARVCAARGHEVVLFEAGERVGGQVAIASRAPRRRELIGITDWLAAEALRYGADLRTGCYVEADDVLAHSPEVIVVASGGLPDTDFLQREGREGSALAVSSWDILSGQVAAGQRVLLYDDEGGHGALSCLEFILACSKEEGREREVLFATPDRFAGQELGGTNYPAYYRSIYEESVSRLPDHRLLDLQREGNGIRARLVNVHTDGMEEHLVDQVVVEHGSVPADGIYQELRGGSCNGGELDVAALLGGSPQPGMEGDVEGYWLFRVGDAVSCRNIHAAVYDSLRLCRNF